MIINITTLDFFTIKRTVEFIKSQPDYDNQGVRKYVFDRAKELGISIRECIDDLQISAIDLYVGKNFVN
jgi:hypothetical protein